MASESVVSFLDRAKTDRLLPADQVEELVQRPDVPSHSLSALCDFLIDRGSLTPYQAECIRSGKEAELNFSGYPVVAELGPCPGGVAYKALHPSLRSPILLRRLRIDWFAPADNVAAFVGRAQAASTTAHPHLANLFDAGVFLDEPFVTLEPFDGANLRTLVTDIGAMPGVLAVNYGRQIALGLQAAHERGLVHGDVRPTNVQIGPLVPMSKPRPDGTPRFRPAPTGVVKVMELGLVPRRPAANDWIAADPGVTVDDVAYLPPERFQSGEPTFAGDVYGLGATLYFLVTGRPPHAGATAVEGMASAESGSPTPLAALRPDLGADLVAFVQELMATNPAERPSMMVAAEKLGQLAGLPTVSPPPPATPVADVTLAAPDDGPDGADFTPLESVAGEADVAPLESAPGEADVTPFVPPSADEIVPAEAGDFIAAPQPAAWVAVPYQGVHDPAAAAGHYTLPEYQAQAAWPAPAAAENAWGPTPAGEPEGFDHADAAGDDSPPRPRDAERGGGKLYMWLALGAGLQILAVLLWVYFFFQPGGSSDPEPKKSTPTKRSK